MVWGRGPSDGPRPTPVEAAIPRLPDGDRDRVLAEALDRSGPQDHRVCGEQAAIPFEFELLFGQFELRADGEAL